MSELEDNKGTYKKYLFVHQEGRLKCKNNLEGAISRQETIEKAERKFEIYREREMRLLESDFDKASSKPSWRITRSNKRSPSLVEIIYTTNVSKARSPESL